MIIKEEQTSILCGIPIQIVKYFVMLEYVGCIKLKRNVNTIIINDFFLNANVYVIVISTFSKNSYTVYSLPRCNISIL